ncbi:MAG TPA: CarD family transcriptional regulator, partial [Chitinophagaceae bacterium]
LSTGFTGKADKREPFVSLPLLMNLQALLGSYRNDNRVKQLAEGIALPDPQHFFIPGLTGSAVAMTAAAVWDLTAANHVFVLRDREEAAYFQNDLESLTDALDIFYFPDSFKKSGDFSAMNNSHVMLRTEALLKLSGAGIHKKVLVTYPEAIFEKVVPPKVLAGSMIQVKSGDVLPVDALLEKLVSLGFERTDFVYEPGQFAMRGGILDIYSFGNEKPYRIELFGDEVDSIRIFDPETQLSERKLLQVTLLPNVETQTGQGEKASLFEFLPAHTIWWIKDPVWTKELLEQLEGKLKVFLQSGLKVTAGDDGEPVGISAGDFETADALFAAWQQVTTVEFGNPASIPGNYPDQREIFPGSAGANAQLSTLSPPKEPLRTQRSEGVLTDTTPQRSPYGHNTQLFSPLPVLTANHQLDFHTAVQPVFNRQFELLIKDLQQHARDNYAIFLFAENPKQLERLHAIFADLKAAISFYPIPVAISQGFIDRDLKLVCYTDHQLFQRYHKYRVRQAYSKNRALTLKALRELQPGDYVTHIDHGVGVYSGLQKIEVNGKMQEAVRIVYKNNDLLYVNINSLHKISKYTGKEGAVPKVNKLGSDVWEKLKEKTRSRVKDIAKDLIKLYAARKAEKGFSHSPDTYLQTELEASFLYEDTPDQSKATADVKKDMEAPAPMDRLICGDVGFGKTEVAVRAAFKTVTDNKQAAILVPTTILAYQHYQTFSERLSDFPCTVDFINRFKSAKDKKETLEKLAAGKIDIIIGTHALLGKEVKFKDLGVL